ncbi:hypothetical protein E4U17_004217 [Claviceps sp. LM77 group G4]|nr:hypothetical protein E4U17_004217 [Claviceps sp. LM77 group G4]
MGNIYKTEPHESLSPQEKTVFPSPRFNTLSAFPSQSPHLNLPFFHLDNGQYTSHPSPQRGPLGPARHGGKRHPRKVGGPPSSSRALGGNRLARAEREARRLELETQTNPAGLRRGNDPDESNRDEAPLGHQRGPSPADSETFLGENLPLKVIAISNKLPSVAAQDVDDVRTGKLDFLNLIRLHPSLGKRPSDDDGTSVVDIYDLRRNHCPQKKTHTLKGYPEPLVFLHCFQKYVWIYDQFYRKEHPEVPSAQLQFSIFITQQAEIFPWGKCRRYAMDRLSHIGISNIHDAKLWEERPPDWIHQHFSYVPLPVTQKRQRTNTVDASGDSSAIC